MRRVWAILAIALLCGCGTRLVHEPPEPAGGAPLAGAADARLAATLDAVIVPGSPAAWAHDAEWDEYRLKVRGLASETVTVIRVALVDALGERVPARAGRLALAEGSRETQQRYAASGKLARREADGSWMILGGTATAVGGAFVGSAAALGSVASMGAAVSSGAATALAVAPVLMLGGAGVVAGGVIQMRNNAQVDRAIRERQTILPVFVAPHAQAVLDVFFPVTPLPKAVTITYMDSKGTHSLLLETQYLLALAHVPAR